MNDTKELVLKLRAYGMNILKLFVDASYATHSGIKRHTGSVTTMGKVSIISKSMKQKLNTKNSTE